MRLRSLGALVLLIVCCILTGCGGGAGTVASTSVAPSNATKTPETTPIKHVVFMLQENRSFDSYFGMLNDYRRLNGQPEDVDGLPAGAQNPSFDGSGSVAAFHFLTMCHEGLSPAWNDSHAQVNRNNPAASTGPMDGFAFTAAQFARLSGFQDTAGIRAMGHYDWNDLPYYYFLANQFATSDRFFSPSLTRTTPNRLYGFATTSTGHVYPPSSTFTTRTIFHGLEERGISWRIYFTDRLADGTPVTGRSYFQPFFSQHRDHLLPASQFAADA